MKNTNRKPQYKRTHYEIKYGRNKEGKTNVRKKEKCTENKK